MPAKGTSGQIVIPNVAIFQAGRWQGEDYSTADLDDMVANFERFSEHLHPPVVIGHEEDQELLANTGIPAAGYVVGLRRHGTRLFADLSQVFPDIADLVEAGAYRHVSAEVYPRDRPPEGIPARGCMLRRVALLGGQLPHIKTLADLPRPVRFSDRVRRSPRVYLHSRTRLWFPGSQTWACFSEVFKMADNALKEAAIAAIMASPPQITEEFLQSLEDDQLALLAKGGTEPEMPPEGEPAQLQEPGMDTGAPVVWPDNKSRQDIEAELAAMGEDPAALAAMSDADLLALYQEKAGATPMSEFDLLEDDDVSTPAPAAKPKKRTVTEQFSERRMANLETRLSRAEKRQATQEQIQLRRLRAEHRKTVRSFCEELSDAGKVSVAEVEFDRATGKPIGPLAVALSIASPVRKFGEGGRSELDTLMDSLRKRPVRRFSELVQDPLKTDGLADVADSARAYAARRNGRRAASNGN